MNARELAEKIAAHRWFHSIDLGNGIVTPGIKLSPGMWLAAAMPPVPMMPTRTGAAPAVCSAIVPRPLHGRARPTRSRRPASANDTPGACVTPATHGQPGRRYSAAIQPTSPSGVRTFSQRRPSNSRVSPSDVTRAPSG